VFPCHNISHVPLQPRPPLSTARHAHSSSPSSSSAAAAAWRPPPSLVSLAHRRERKGGGEEGEGQFPLLRKFRLFGRRKVRDQYQSRDPNGDNSSRESLTCFPIRLGATFWEGCFPASPSSIERKNRLYANSSSWRECMLGHLALASRYRDRRRRDSRPPNTLVTHKALLLGTRARALRGHARKLPMRAAVVGNRTRAMEMRRGWR